MNAHYYSNPVDGGRTIILYTKRGERSERGSIVLGSQTARNGALDTRYAFLMDYKLVSRVYCEEVHSFL